MKYTIVNQEFIPADKANVLVSDLAIQRGYGIFDFLKTIDNHPVFIDSHLDRFFNSAKVMQLEILVTRDDLKSLLYELIKKNNIPSSGIKLTLTGGYSPDGYSIALPNLIVTQSPIEIQEDVSEIGLKLMTYEHQRQLPHVKSLDYMMAVWLQSRIREYGADDVLYVKDSLVGECPRANFFIVTQNNRILTPKSNILSGVIRKNVLALSNVGFDVSEADITVTDMQNCKEAFITSSTKNIMPVLSIDGKLVGNGKAGSTTLNLSAALKEKIKEDYEFQLTD